MDEPSGKSQQRVQKLVDSFTDKSGTHTHPEPETTEAVMLGLAQHLDQLGRPLCPCRFYPDKTEEIKHRTWVCPCEDIQIYKYCPCLLFVTEEGPADYGVFTRRTRRTSDLRTGRRSYAR